MSTVGRYDTRPRRSPVVQETCNAKTFKQIEFRRCVILKFPPQRIISGGEKWKYTLVRRIKGSLHLLVVKIIVIRSAIIF